MITSLKWALFTVFTCMVLQTAQAERFTVAAGHSEILFDEAAGVPVRWAICAPECADDQAHRAVLFDADDGYFNVSLPQGAAGEFAASVIEGAKETRVEFVSPQASYVYHLSHTDAHVRIDLPANASLKIATGDVFVPEQLPGFGQMYSRVLGVQVSESGQDIYDEEKVDLTAEVENWTGMRSRYWTLLLQPKNAATPVSIDLSQLDRPILQTAATTGGVASFDFYAGPIEWATLKRVSPELSEMLFAALWDFLRALCFGMLMLLEFIQGLVGNYGLAIILLSLTVKILITPISMLAERWQADVNRIQTLLQPELGEIKKNYKGEEAHMRILGVYKKHGVSQLYTFKSAAGFLIQIPVFIAAFDVLAENIALNEIAFLWISDLAKPDAFAELPFVLPFFGGWLNLLPFVMTGLSILAAWLQSEATLSPELQRQQSVRLYRMAALFFVAFYTFPAGMVLYWTSSNLFHLLKVESGRLFKRH